LQGKYISIYE